MGEGMAQSRHEYWAVGDWAACYERDKPSSALCQQPSSRICEFVVSGIELIREGVNTNIN